MSKSAALRANAFLLFGDCLKPMFEGLKSGHTVTRCVYELDDTTSVEFELVVTRVAGKCVPRVVQAP